MKKEAPRAGFPCQHGLHPRREEQFFTMPRAKKRVNGFSRYRLKSLAARDML